MGLGSAGGEYYGDDGELVVVRDPQPEVHALFLDPDCTFLDDGISDPHSRPGCGTGNQMSRCSALKFALLESGDEDLACPQKITLLLARNFG
jgi:hypothetical protein